MSVLDAEAALRHVDGTGPGIARVREGRGVRYAGPAGEPVTDAATLERIAALAVPPAWREVWISPLPDAHLQATGVDARGRKQYRYHPAWRARMDHEKFDDMVAFARAMPRVRARVAQLLAADGLARPRVLGLALRLLDVGLFRVGNEHSAVVDHHYGLTTLRRDQVRVRDGAARFDYVAKSGRRRLLELHEPEAVALLAALKRRRGGPPELLAYRRARAWSHVHSNEVNDALRAAADGPFSAKEFRTWNATVLAAVALAARPGGGTRAVSAAMWAVAEALGNTPAVARASYVDPRVVRAFEAGRTVRVAHVERLDDWSRRARLEAEVVALLEAAPGA